MLRSLLLLFLFSFSNLNFASEIVINGSIGSYPIEMTITSVDMETGNIKGKYRYANKDSYLNIEGLIAGDCIFLSEFYKGKNTGDFYLEKNDKQFLGKWIAGDKWFDVELNTSAKGIKGLAIRPLSDYARICSSALSGGYVAEDYYINDMWFSPEKPVLEIGFGGGKAIIEEIHEDSVKFNISVVCGPTYHMADAYGIAHRTGKYTYECIFDIYEKDTCLIQLKFSDKALFASASQSSYSCGFGMRAYLEHEFTKITDVFDFDEEVSIRDMKKSNGVNE